MHHRQPEPADIIAAQAGGAVVEAFADMDAVAQASGALEEDGVAGNAGDFRQHERSAWELVDTAVASHGDGGDGGEYAVALAGGAVAAAHAAPWGDPLVRAASVTAAAVAAGAGFPPE